MLRAACVGLLFSALAATASAQPYGEPLTPMPRALEISYALSAAPPHLRDGAGVYVLDSGKAYVEVRGSRNGFTCFVGRTEYSREHFTDNLFVPMCYDAEGTRSHVPVYFDTARLRSAGHTSPADLKRLVEDRFRQGVYHPPSRPGIAYMVSPIITAYHGAGSKEVAAVSMPHLMFYAPNLTAADFGGGPPRGTYPYLFDQGPLGYMIQNIGETEKARILADSQELLKELCAFRADLCIERLPTHPNR